MFPRVRSEECGKELSEEGRQDGTLKEKTAGLHAKSMLNSDAI